MKDIAEYLEQTARRGGVFQQKGSDQKKYFMFENGKVVAMQLQKRQQEQKLLIGNLARLCESFLKVENGCGVITGGIL